jgi:hypothetical protein
MFLNLAHTKLGVFNNHKDLLWNVIKVAGSSRMMKNLQSLSQSIVNVFKLLSGMINP